MTNPRITVKQLREALAKYDDKLFVTVWLPGSHIDLAGVMLTRNDEVLIEGNIRPGSALDN